MLINICDIDADASWNSRTIIRDIKELADSIRESGLIQPLVVRKVEERYQLIAGCTENVAPWPIRFCGQLP